MMDSRSRRGIGHVGRGSGPWSKHLVTKQPASETVDLHARSSMGMQPGSIGHRRTQALSRIGLQPAST